MDEPALLWLSIAHRPPLLGPRRRDFDPVAERRLGSWVRSALRLTADAIVSVSEWVATDSRAASHTVYFVVGTGETRRVLVVEKAAERIVQADLVAAVDAPLRTHPTQRPRVAASSRTAAPLD